MSRSEAKFTNDRLVEVWIQVFTDDGTRRDVVEQLMADREEDVTNEDLYSKMYNSVTQRVRHLSKRDKNAISFPALAEGRKGSSTSGSALDALQEKLNAAVAAKNGDNKEEDENDADTSDEGATDES